jgi:hypothetical protein
MPMSNEDFREFAVKISKYVNFKGWRNTRFYLTFYFIPFFGAVLDETFLD